MTAWGWFRAFAHRIPPACGDSDLAAELGRLAGRRTRQVAAAVIDRDGSAQTAFIGADATTPFEVGSLTKAMTGMLLADAVRRGEVTLASTVGTLLPDTAASPLGSVTLRELVHKSAVCNYGVMSDQRLESVYTTRLLTADTWEDFATLVEANNGVWGGCWCMGFHPEGLDKDSASRNRENKHTHVRRGTVHQVLVYEGQECVGWCQYGTPVELPAIQNPKAYDKELTDLPDWRIGCIFTGKGHRRSGVARAAVTAALAAIKEAGGGLVEAYPEQVDGREAQRGSYFHTGPENLFEELGFERDRQIAKWRWVMRHCVRP